MLLSFLAGIDFVSAQQPVTPRIGYVYPAGGRQGTKFQVKVGGQFLDGATNVYVSGGGISATVLEHTKPLTPQQANALREKARELQEKRQAIQKSRREGGSQSGTNLTWTAADMKALTEIRNKLAVFQRRPSTPAIAETALLHVTIAGDAEVGQRELRLAGRQGLSNPLSFCVGQLPEFTKQKSAGEPEPAVRPALRRNAEQKATPPTETRITLPVIVNGQVLQGGVDRYRFHARAGQKLVINVSARELIPYLPDAVPGWFQAALALYDAQGKELAYSGDYRFHPDPVLYFEVPKEGEYLVEIRDSVFRGREDFIYRISLSESPFITSLFPLGGPAGEQTMVNLKGWNLPVNTLVLDERTNRPGQYPISLAKERLISNRVPFAVDVLPELVEQEPNNNFTGAQTVTIPAIVNGRISEPGDWDTFAFQGQAGQQIVAEVYARRLDSPLDSVLKLTDSAGRQLAYNDDHEDKGAGLNTHHADSYLKATLPVSGSYYVQIGDAQRQGGEEYGYRLRISQPRPDFELRVTPASINVRPGLSVPITVYALRKDGFTNQIMVALDKAPPGVSLSGGRIPANQDQVRMTLTTQPALPDEPADIFLEGHAMIASQLVSHRAVPAEDMMQAFAYRHLVPCQELKLAVTGRGPARSGVRLASEQPVKIPLGGSAHVKLSGPGAMFSSRFSLELSEPPEGVSLEKVASSDSGADLLFRCDASKAKTGLQGNLIVGLIPERPAAAQNPKKQANQRRGMIGTLPAIPFEIIRGDL